MLVHCSTTTNTTITTTTATTNDDTEEDGPLAPTELRWPLVNLAGLDDDVVLLQQGHRFGRG